MDHKKIEDDFVIEQFVAGELQPDARREFYEHCLHCPSCRQGVYLSAKIDEGLLQSQLERKKQHGSQPNAKSKVMPYLAVAFMLVLSFTVGMLVNRGGEEKSNVALTEKRDSADKKTENQVVEVLKPSPVVTRQNDKPAQKEPLAKVEHPKQEPVMQQHISSDLPLLAMADIPPDKAIESMNIPGTMVQTKSGNSQSGNTEKFMDRLNAQSDYFNPDLIINKPSQNASLSTAEPFMAAWECSNKNSSFTVMVVDQMRTKFMSADIQGMKFKLNRTLPRGEYFFIVKEHGGDNWHVVKFRVR